MSKKIMGLIIFMCAFSFFTYDVKAESCGFYIGNDYIDAENLELSDGDDGKVTFSEDTITFENFDYEGEGRIIESEATFYAAVSNSCSKSYKIVLKGENNIKFNTPDLTDDVAATYANVGLYSERGLNIEGDGKLNIYTDDSKEYYASIGIYVGNSLIVKNSTLNIYSSKTNCSGAGIMSLDGILMEKANVYTHVAGSDDEDSESYGFYSDYDITIVNSNVSLEVEDGNNVRGVYVYGPVIINGSSFDLNVGEGEMYSFGFTIMDGDLTSCESVISAYSYGPVLNIDDGATFYATALQLASQEGLLNTDYKVNFESYDPLKVFVSTTSDGKNLTEWNEEGYLTNYKYLKIMSSNEEGSFNIETDNNKLNITSDDLSKIIPLTEWEKVKVEQGLDVIISLRTSELKEDISEEDQAIIEDNLDGYTIGSYLDVSLYKKVGSSKEEKLSVLSDKIKLSFELDDKLINNDDKITRTYKVIKVHDGIPEFLETTYDEETNIIVFESNSFSSYALLYFDEDNEPKEELEEEEEIVEEETEVVEEINEEEKKEENIENPKTNDRLYIYIITLIISTISLIAIIKYKRAN